LITGDQSVLLGIFTDSDLARLFEKRREADFDRPIGAIMTVNPYTIHVGATLTDAIELMKAHKISELPVIDHGQCLVGLIDVTDLIGLVPDDLME
jgi:arabinose-5-phosphate isomerase